MPSRYAFECECALPPIFAYLKAWFKTAKLQLTNKKHEIENEVAVKWNDSTMEKLFGEVPDTTTL